MVAASFGVKVCLDWLIDIMFVHLKVLRVELLFCVGWGMCGSICIGWRVVLYRRWGVHIRSEFGLRLLVHLRINLPDPDPDCQTMSTCTLWSYGKPFYTYNTYQRPTEEPASISPLIHQQIFHGCASGALENSHWGVLQPTRTWCSVAWPAGWLTIHSTGCLSYWYFCHCLTKPPVVFKNYFIENHSIHQHNTRQTKDLHNIHANDDNKNNR